MADQVTRGAARLATIITVPVVLLVGVLVFVLLRDRVHQPAASPSATPQPPSAQSSQPVPMTAAKLSTRQVTVCRALLSQLPAVVHQLVQRPVTAGAEQNAAYGDPAVTLACGAKPPTVAPTDMVYPLNGVCWYPVKGPDGTRWTTLDREVPVTVTVPGAYDPAGQWVIPFSNPVASTVPSAGKVPFGCQ